MTHTISVIIPAYHAEEYIDRSVRSLLAQTRSDWEAVIVADDLADYAECLRRHGITDPRLRFTTTGSHGTGCAHPRNVGLDAARGRIVAALDADDALDPQALELLAPAAEQWGAAYSNIRLLDHVTEVELPNYDRVIASGPVCLEDIMTTHLHAFAGIVFDRTRVQTCWPGWLKRWEDLYFVASCFDYIDRMYHVAAPLYIYYRREGSICNRADTGAQYLSWAVDVVGRIERGDDIGIRDPGVRELLRRYWIHWQGIERTYLAACAAGGSDDFQAFIKHNRELFFRLDAPAAKPT